MDVSKFNLFGVLFNFKDKKARDDHAALAETVGVHGEDIQGLQAPTFSEPAANANVREAVAKVKSGATLGTLFTNVKAALNGLITLGEMRNYLVNNGTVTETGKYFLDAAYGKTLLDQITALNSNIGNYFKFVDFQAFSNSTKYFSYEPQTNGVYLMATLHHGSWTYNSICVIYILENGKSGVNKLDHGYEFDEYISITIDDDNHRIVVANSGLATIHCALYQLLKIKRGEL